MRRDSAAAAAAEVPPTARRFSDISRAVALATTYSRRSPRPHGLAVACVALALTACTSETPQSQPEVRAYDSARVRIVENPPLDPNNTTVLGVGEPFLDIGYGESPEYEFGRIYRVHWLGDTSLVTIDYLAHELRMYSADGQLLGAAGREGEGPGEFKQALWTYGFRGDSVLVFDSALRRFSVFGPDLRFARTFRLPPPEGMVAYAVAGALSDGTLLIYGQYIEEFSIEPGPWTAYRRIFVARPDTSPIQLPDSVADDIYNHERGQAVPLFGRTGVAVGRDDWFIIASTGDFDIRVYDQTGRLNRVVRRSGTNRTVTDEMASNAREYFMSYFPESSPFREAFARAYNEMPIPERAPAFGAASVAWRTPVAFLDDSDRLWVKEYDYRMFTPQLWSVFDSTGVFTHQVRTPARFHLHDVSHNRLLGLYQDEFDVQYVRAYRVDPSPAEESER